MVIGHRDRGGVEGIGFNDVSARFKIGVMDSGDDVRFRQDQQVVIAFEIGSPVGKALAAIIRFFKTIALDHGSHTAIKHQNTFIQLLEQFFSVISHSYSRLIIQPCQAMCSYWHTLP